jgi:subtilisin family serine protease
LVAVFPNRVIRVPPVVRAASVPTAVSENTRYTWGVSRTGAMACWGAFGARGEGVKVAVLDTGVDANHPDLKGKVTGYAEFDETGSTTVDDPTKARDTERHGTHCAGTIAGGMASGRWIGMAPKAQILAGVVLPKGVGTDKQILAGMQWAIDSGAHVLSMSLGGLRMGPDVLDTYTLTILNANRMGIPVVIAVGNEGEQTSGSPGNDLFAFTVGATDVNDQVAGFSGGRTQVIFRSRYIAERFLPLTYSKPEVTAPGVHVYSSIPGGKWEIFSGSSMATPHVAGAMALLLSKPTELAPTRTIAELTGRTKIDVLQQLLISTVKELGEAGQDHRFGYGRIDVLRAFGFALTQGYFGDEFAEE